MSPNSESLATSAIPISGQPSTSKGEQRHVDKTAMSRRRASSNSSASSAMSPGFKSETEDQFVFSPHQAPPHEPSSFFPPTHPRGPSSLVTPLATGSNHSGVENPIQNCRPPTTTSNDPPTPHSQPIAIELPPSISHRIAAKSVYTPIEPPLTGRGDLHQGGYFAFDGHPERHIIRPQPQAFSADSPKAHQHPVPFYGRRSQVDQLLPAKSSVPNIVAPELLRDEISTPMSPVTMSSSRINTPITSYVPSGHQNSVPMSLGKYYPTNYEAARSRQNSGQRSSRTPRTALRPPSVGGLASSSNKSGTQVSQLNQSDATRTRTDSDAKRRLQQYQRDMVAQATQAARSLAGAKGPAGLAAAHGVVVPNFQIASNKPTSPRLQPLGSPGPVTPMELEAQGDGGYLTRGRAVPSPDSRRDNQAIAKALKAEEERKQREGRGSPTVQAGGFGF